MAASQTIRTLKLSLLADVSSFGKDLGKAGSDFQKFANGVETASRFAVGALGALGAAAFDSIQLASDLAETQSKVEQIFGPEGRRQLEQYANTANQSLGQTRRQALDAAATFGIFGQAAGLSGEDLITFSTDLTTLASDLASFNNTDVDTAITALGAALRGESEPIRQFGVLLNEETLRSRAFALGLVEDVDTQLTLQQRVIAAQAEVLAQTTTQQGDFARTADGLANSQRILTSRFEDFRTELGEQLLPIAEELLPRLFGFLDRLEEVDPETFVEVATAIGQIATAIVALNAALKVFATVQGAWAFLSSSVGRLAGVFGLIASISGSTPQDPYDQLRLDSGFSDYEARFYLRTGRRLQESEFRDTGPVNIIINGYVGNEAALAREVQRNLDLARRRGIVTIPSGDISGSAPSIGIPE